MKRILLVVSCLLCSTPAFALTATWKANSEPDMKEYVVYMCKVKGCTVQQNPTQQVAVVPHSAAPSWILPNQIEGTLAVSAKDQDGNESGLSNQVPFDSLAPASPSSVGVTK